MSPLWRAALVLMAIAVIAIAVFMVKVGWDVINIPGEPNGV